MSKKEYLEESFPKHLQKISSEHNAVNPEKIANFFAAYFFGPNKFCKKGPGCFFNVLDAFRNVLDAFSNVLDAFSNDSNMNPESRDFTVFPKHNGNPDKNSLNLW
jgi:hypothetical protein